MSDVKVFRGTLTPAYGRDYKSKKALLEDFNANKDFILNSPTSQDYVNREDLNASTTTSIQVRWKGMTMVGIIKRKSNSEEWA